MSSLVSIIVPVYNVQQYLEQCISSIMAQTYKNIEVILVDDGSTDGSGEICDQMALLDNRIRVLHKANGGLSDARNCGLSSSQGEYIAFVDSDDYISPVFIETLLQAIVFSGAQVSALPGGISFHDGEDPLLRTANQVERIAELPINDLDIATYLERMLYQQYATGAPWRLYHRSLLGDEPFPKGIYYEDLASTYIIVGRANRIAFVDLTDLYAYRLRSTSIIRQRFTPLKSYSSIMVSRQLYTDICHDYPKLQKAAASRCFAVNRMVFAQVPGSETEAKRDLWAEMEKHRSTVLADSNARKRERVAAAVASLGFWPFSAFCSMCRIVGLMQ